MKKKGLIALIIAAVVIVCAYGYGGDEKEPSAPDTDISVEQTVSGESTSEENGSEDKEQSDSEETKNEDSENKETAEQNQDEDKPGEDKPGEDKPKEKFVRPEYTGEAFTVINNNEPYFEKGELTDVSFESYGALDALCRCTVTLASVGRDIMPTEERGNIGQIKPTGWQTVKYDCVDGKYLYNRCHLIGFQLTGENANEKNLITGTRYMNVEGMLPFENMVADYVKETENHVMYRVTPVYESDELLARGVLMEAFSVEDGGEGICFCVFVHNVQPQIEINYQDGTSKLIKTPEQELKKEPEQELKKEPEQETEEEPEQEDYVLNKNTKKFHYPSCRSAKTIKDSNREEYTGTRDALLERGYSPCKNCDP